MTIIGFHRETSRSFILQSEVELRAGHRMQASEKAWGAAARGIKSVAELYGRPHNDHRDLFSVVDNIVRLSGDTEVRSLFDDANALDQNTYEGWLSDEHISLSIERVKRLLDKLDAFMDANNNGAGG